MDQDLGSDLPTLVRALSGRVDPARLRYDVELLADRPRGRTAAPEAMARAEAHVVRELTEAGWRTERRPFDVRGRLGCSDRPGGGMSPLRLRLHRRLTGANLLARLPGADDRPTVIVGAHLDTVRGSPGADDNASGVAALLETARLLGGLPGRPPAVTLMVFDMEELGFIGSRVAARRLRRDGTTPQAGMICLESVGCFATEPGTQRLPKGFGLLFPRAVAAVRATGLRGDFTLVVHRRSTDQAASLWQRAAGAAEPPLPVVTLRDPRPDGPLGALAGLLLPPLNQLGRSDHAAFWNAGIPAVLLTSTAEFRNPHYHRPTDTPDTLDYSRLASVTAATTATALSWRPRRPG
ncbi:M28 family peptidase [Streptomyces lateritius]|uniref:M28 family peptidase n=1 Tax=Streptomyces lateritius TaxID=67313 RepID=UPI00167559C1|nr:M28 family peptidase [Streptomyces lateritius]GGT73650.1 hypothetical protein GCM10010272_16270 [Streptomyces lateritius]